MSPVSSVVASYSIDPSPPDNAISIVENHCLAGADGELGRVEHHLGVGVTDPSHGRRRRLVAMADLRGDAERTLRLVHNPVHAGRRQPRPLQR